MNRPIVSVVMSVYKEPFVFLQAAVDSILNQTLQELEFIIINDNPENSNLDYLKSLAEDNEAVRLVCNENNLGLPASLNIGVKLARGQYVARMDADDISLPTRLEEQLKYLESNNYDLVGCYIERIDESGKSISIGKLPQKPKSLKRLLPYATIAFHPTWFARSEVLKNNPYNPLFITSQDYELLHRLVRCGVTISNLDKPLLKYRLNPDAISSKKSYIQFRIHNLVNNFKTLESLDLKVKRLLEDVDHLKKKSFDDCRMRIFKKRINVDLLRCLFKKDALFFLYKSVMSFLVKRYG